MTLNVTSFVHEGLGNSSYLLGLDETRAALIDPDRSVKRYLDTAAAAGLRIDQVWETHVHADFVSGARELAAANGATIFMPAGAGTRVEHVEAQPGSALTLDGMQVETVASPGHSPEHVSYVFSSGLQPPLLFSGGSLIVGGAGRTDLLGEARTEELTRAQYGTLQNSFVSLPDETLLYPTHGGGSFCSAGGNGDRSSTLGAERRSNEALLFRGEEEFLSWFPASFPAAPTYFFRMREFNQAGPRLRTDVAMPPALAPGAFKEAAKGGLIVDVRSPREFTTQHIPNSLSIYLKETYATWLGWLVPENTRLSFVKDDDQSLEHVVDESLLVGYENLGGWLEGGIEAWKATGLPVAGAGIVDVEQAEDLLADGALALDVRERSEWDGGHIEGAKHLPLGILEAELSDLPTDRPIVTYCAHGPRATSALSILERGGIQVASQP